MDVRRGREGKRSLKKHIAVIIALITVMTFMVPVYSEPVNNEPGQPGIENPAPQPEAGDPGVQEPVADPNADNTVPVADPNANPAVDPNVTPGTDPNAVPGTETDLQIPENTGLENIRTHEPVAFEFSFDEHGRGQGIVHEKNAKLIQIFNTTLTYMIS